MNWSIFYSIIIYRGKNVIGLEMFLMQLSICSIRLLIFFFYNKRVNEHRWIFVVDFEVTVSVLYVTCRKYFKSILFVSTTLFHFKVSYQN